MKKLLLALLAIALLSGQQSNCSNQGGRPGRIVTTYYNKCDWRVQFWDENKNLIYDNKHHAWKIYRGRG